MTLAEILSNEELRQHEFPVARDKIFLAHAGVCPAAPPRGGGGRAIRPSGRDQRPGTQSSMPRFWKPAAGWRRRLLNAQPEEIALVGPTSLALSLIAGSLKLRKNDNVLIYFDDYPSNVYPWMALAERGVQVRLINTREYGVIRPVDVMGQVDEQTRLVALASCHFIAGTRLDYQAIGKFLRERNILFCLDAIQTRGRVSHDGGARGFPGGGFAQMAAGPVRGGIDVCAARAGGAVAAVRAGLEQRALPEFCRAGADWCSGRTRSGSRLARIICSAWWG